MHPCLVCGKWITWRFAICAECEKEHGQSALEWEPWLRFAWNEEQRRRRAAKKIRNNEISFTDLEDCLRDEDTAHE